MKIKRFPRRLILEAINLRAIPKSIAKRAFTSINSDLMALMCHVFPDYGKMEFAYMFLGEAVKKDLVPALQKQFPTLATLDVRHVKKPNDWEKIVQTQIATFGKMIAVSRPPEITDQKAFLVGTHRYTFRAGKPAEIIGIVFATPLGHKTRPVYRIRFSDGHTDCVPLSDVHVNPHHKIISEADVKARRIPKIAH